MNYIFNFNNSRLYKKWAEDPANAKLIAKQIDLAFSMLDPMPESSILDIGCKLGFNLDFFIKKRIKCHRRRSLPLSDRFCIKKAEK
jgi:hypothetical protein